PGPAPAARLLGWLRCRRRLLAALVAVAAAVLTGAVALWNSSEPHAQTGLSVATPGPPGTAHAPPTGWVTLHIASDPALCLSDGRVRDWRYTPLVAVQRPCDATAPQSTLLEPVGQDLYRVQWHHPDYGKGCLKALTSGSGAGLLEPMDDCADGSLFRVEPSGKLALGRFVLRVEGEGCVGIVRSSKAPGAEAVMQRCNGKGRQVFLIRAVDGGDGTGRSASSTVPSTRAAGK
ncbi:RICIN domain-containing protein, partial [Streptomyces flavofungini]|uniref:RICIN domain-containing protein n=1 Tax=Streptomyces flavofungini TaxID=68200 RepID=UPI0034DE7A3E